MYQSTDMQMVDKETFQQQINDLEQVYECKITPREIKVLKQTLGHLSNQQLIEAIDATVAEYSFRPRANRILELVQGKQKALLNQEAQEEWGNVLEASKKPQGEKISLTNKRTLLALKRIGGIRAIAEAPLAQLSWKRKDFLEQYEEIGEVEKALSTTPESLPDSLRQSVDDYLTHPHSQPFYPVSVSTGMEEAISEENRVFSYL